MKVIKISTGAKFDAAQFVSMPIISPNPSGIMKFSEGWFIDGNNGRFQVKHGEWVVRKDNIIEIVSPQDFSINFKPIEDKPQVNLVDTSEYNI
jgi:hypothetical protein